MRFLFIVSALGFLAEASMLGSTVAKEESQQGGGVAALGSTVETKPDVNAIRLDYPREFGYRAPGNTFFNSLKPLSSVQLDWFCTLKFNPVNARKISENKNLRLVQEELDQLNDSQVKEDLKAVLTERMRGEFCIDTPPPIKDNRIELVAARLTRSQHKDQATIHCTYSEEVGKEESAKRVASYTIPDKYSSDLLKQEKYNIGMTTEAMSVHKPKGYELKLTKVEDHYDKHTDIEDEDSRYGADLWCTAIVEKRKEVEAILFEFLDSLSAKPVIEPPKMPVVEPATEVVEVKSSDKVVKEHKPPVEFLGGPLDITYSHGARFGKTNNQCSITFFGSWSDDVNLASDYERLVSMNHQGLCFGGKSLDEVVPAPASVNLAVLEKDTHSENPVLKCFERFAVATSEGTEKGVEQIFAEYRLPFGYHAFDTLKQTPITIKPAEPPKKDGDKTTGEEAGSNPQDEGSDKSDSAQGGQFGRSFFSGSISSKMASMGKDSRVGIEFIDKYNDPFSGTDKTNASGFMAKQYCSHLMYMKNVFEALNLTMENKSLLTFSTALGRVRNQYHIPSTEELNAAAKPIQALGRAFLTRVKPQNDEKVRREVAQGTAEKVVALVTEEVLRAQTVALPSSNDGKKTGRK